jgi:sugar phosphate isomerase/epimerase
MRRRQFLNAMTAAAGMPSRAIPHWRWQGRLSRIGLELYTVRDAMKANPEGTLAAVRAIGYTDVELLWSFNNFGRSVEQVRASLRHLGLRAPSAHIAPESLLTNWQQSLDRANYLGHQYLVVPSLPSDTRTSLDAWRAWADRFNRAGEAARQSGLWLAFHNEPEHQNRIDGQVPYDLFIQQTDPSRVRLQLDVGNMVLGGGDPHAYLAAHSERYWSFHLKDVAPDHHHDTELGAGEFDFRRFLAAVGELNLKPCYIEQEAAAEPVVSAKRSFQYLRALRF